jgi:hypothetical protein
MAWSMRDVCSRLIRTEHGSSISTQRGHEAEMDERPVVCSGQEPVVADKPAHGRHWRADIRSGLRYWLERPLCEAQPTKSCDWAGPLLERLLTRRAN